MRLFRPCCIAIPLIILAASILRLMPEMSPARKGNSDEFWYYACHVNLTGSEKNVFGGFYPARDGWLVYYVQEIHDQRLYRIRPADAERDWPEVARLLETAPTEQNIPECVLAGFAEWKQTQDIRKVDVDGLLTSIRAAAIARLAAKGADSLEYFLWEERLFDRRWESYGRYPLNALFEFAYLGGLIVFSAWPWLRRRGWQTWTIHCSAAPLLFFTPYFLGYAWTTFLSRGPSGGILYPHLIFPFRAWNGWWSQADRLVFASIPRILEPLSQPLGPYMAISYMGSVSPVAILMVSLGIALLLSAIRWIVRRTASRPQSFHPLES